MGITTRTTGKASSQLISQALSQALTRPGVMPWLFIVETRETNAHMKMDRSSDVMNGA